MTIRKSNRGVDVDFDTLIKNSDLRSTALGNMRVNAKGDRLGKSGEITQRNEDRVREYYTNNPKSSTSTASLKGRQPSRAIPDQLDEIDNKEGQEVSSEYEERELPNGDIEVVRPSRKRKSKQEKD